MSNIQIFFEDVHPVKIKKKYVIDNIKYLIFSELKKVGDVSIIFCSDKFLLDINTKYLSHNYFTDIITFDYVEGSVISGDLFISIERIKENAKNYDDEFFVELIRVVFHGILHLIGYNDKTEGEKIEMRQEEDYYLKKVDFSRI